MQHIYCFNDVEYDLSNDSLNEFPLFTLETIAVNCNVNLQVIKDNTDYAYRRKRDKSGWEQSFINRIIDAICDYRDCPIKR
jgi:hypothetical protein